jgi:RNA polymerase sigma-70 factor (ECF subfamily)
MFRVSGDRMVAAHPERCGFSEHASVVHDAMAHTCRIFSLADRPAWDDILEAVIRSLVPAAVNDETDLLARARALDGRALSQIHDQYYPALYRFALYRTGDTAAAEDIAAEVFVRLLDALHARRAPQSTLRGWLFGVAGHLVADHFRRRPAGPLPDTLPDTLPAGGSPAVEAEDRLQRQAVVSALQRLSPEQQNVLALRFGEGASLEETAGALGKNVNAVKQLQFRAVAALRKALAVETLGHD